LLKLPLRSTIVHRFGFLWSTFVISNHVLSIGLLLCCLIPVSLTLDDRADERGLNGYAARGPVL